MRSNKNILLYSIAILFVPFYLNAQDKTIEFSINCDVLDSNVLSMEQGKSKRYGFINDGYKAGDLMQLNFEYKFYKYTTMLDQYYLNIFDRRYQNSSLINASVNSDEFSKFFQDMIVIKGIDQIYISKNYLSLEGIGANLTLDRYYKDDWQGIYFYEYSNSIHTMTLNCIGITDKYDALVNEIKNFHEQ